MTTLACLLPGAIGQLVSRSEIGHIKHNLFRQKHIVKVVAPAIAAIYYKRRKSMHPMWKQYIPGEALSVSAPTASWLS